MSYLLKLDGRWVAFSGDVMLDGAKMHTWFDTEWDYGFAKGLYELISSVSLLQSYEPAYLLPSHGQSRRWGDGAVAGISEQAPQAGQAVRARL